jgi:hypothetical protein
VKDKGSAIAETRSSQIWLRDDGIVQVRVNRGVEIELEDAEEILAVLQALSGGRRPMLLDYRWSHSLTLEARIRLLQPPVITALAMLAWTHIARISCEFLLSTSSPPYPARVFTSEEEAILWLKQYV